MKMYAPYIGVTGFTNFREVEAALDVFPASLTPGSHQLMVGVLATWKSLRGIPINPKWLKQMPDKEKIGDLFPVDYRTVNLVHYSIEEGQEHSLPEDMVRIHQLV